MKKKKTKNDYNEFVRVFGSEPMTKGTYRWILTMKNYIRSDQKGIVFGICEEELFREQ